MWDDVEMFHIDTFLPLIFSHLCGKMDEQRRAQQQNLIRSVVLAGFGILAIALVLVPGQSFWNVLRSWLSVSYTHLILTGPQPSMAAASSRSCGMLRMNCTSW